MIAAEWGVIVSVVFVVVFLTSPVLFYLCIKLGAWGYFRAKYGFEIWKQEQEQRRAILHWKKQVYDCDDDGRRPNNSERN